MRSNRSILHFFFIYFSSVAVLIIGAGFFYFYQQTSQLISLEKASILQYVKMQQYTDGTYKDRHFSFEKKSVYKSWFEDTKLQEKDGFFVYEAPTQHPNEFLVIKKSMKPYEEAKIKMLIKLLGVQGTLLLIFLLISWFLARESIRPLNEMISNLDDFIKNLVHDLNTPATSILVNARLLQTKKGKNDTKRIERIESSTKEILSLYKNLSALLNEHKLILEQHDIVPIIQNSTVYFKERYTEVSFEFNLPSKCEVKIDQQAFEQILNNLFSNASKYSAKENAKIVVSIKGNVLYIKDNGLGMDAPHKVFKRLYCEHTQGHGIGMYIVKKLSEGMLIDIAFHSHKGKGTEVVLSFPG
ncbi:MAG TPA: HAMP domain-containing histidine kinase [Sulfurimonas sp.]|nr:HAMP domain-containing histidine kinase [Sulfurimonas sp.]